MSEKNKVYIASAGERDDEPFDMSEFAGGLAEIVDDGIDLDKYLDTLKLPRMVVDEETGRVRNRTFRERVHVIVMHLTPKKREDKPWQKQQS